MSNAIYGLAKQGGNYYQIPHNLQEKIAQALLHAMSFMNEQEVSNTIYSHGVMGVRWADLSSELHDCLRYVFCYTIVLPFVMSLSGLLSMCCSLMHSLTPHDMSLTIIPLPKSTSHCL